VLDLPTGKGLCESCEAVEKLWRTFFDIRHGSGWWQATASSPAHGFPSP
jgi:hypothetical protein